MKRFACHYLYDSLGTCYVKYIVEINEDNRVNRYFPLKEEISATQWVGGVIILSPFSELEIFPQETFHSFLKRVIVETDEPQYVWHILPFDFVKKDFTNFSRLVRL